MKDINATASTITTSEMPTFQNEKEGSIFSEAQRAEAGVGFLGMGQRALSSPARESGEHCKLFQQGPGQSPSHQMVFATF